MKMSIKHILTFPDFSFLRIVEIVEADGTVALVEIVGQIEAVPYRAVDPRSDASVYLVMAIDT